MTIKTEIILCGATRFICRHDRPNAIGRNAANAMCVRKSPSTRMIEAQRAQFRFLHRPIPKTTDTKENNINPAKYVVSIYLSMNITMPTGTPNTPYAIFSIAKIFNPRGRCIQVPFLGNMAAERYMHAARVAAEPALRHGECRIILMYCSPRLKNKILPSCGFQHREMGFSSAGFSLWGLVHAGPNPTG
jgi:hypothetical protein